MTAPLCLLTRPRAQSLTFAALLPEIDCLIAPILRIVPLPFEAGLLAGASGFVFTSANAVPFAGPGQGRPALVVGPQTAEAARLAGFDVHEGPGDAEGMLPLLQGREGWLHLHGRHRARVLPVPGIAVYDQVAEPLTADAIAALAGERPLILPLFSPRSAALLTDVAMDAQAPIATVAISARADAAYQGAVRMRFIAPHPEGDAMARVIASLVAGERSGKPWVETERGGR